MNYVTEFVDPESPEKPQYKVPVQDSVLLSKGPSFSKRYEPCQFLKRDTLYPL